MSCKLPILHAAAALLIIVSCTPFGRGGQPSDADSLSVAARDGDARAQLRMGLRCDRDSLYEEAVRWYELAARQGLSEAQNNLG